MEMINRSQVRKIKVLQKSRGIDDDVYRGALLSMFRVSSCTKLTKPQATRFIDWLSGDRCAPCLTRRERPTGERPPEEIKYPVTENQLQDIRLLKGNIHWAVWNGYALWLMKFYHVVEIKDSRLAGKVIAGLRGLCKQQHGCECNGVCTRQPQDERKPLTYRRKERAA